MVKRNESFEELRFSYYSHGRQRELKERDRWLHVLKFITGIEGINLPQLLSETDNAGYTPFLSALAAKTYSHASHMLKVILELEPANPGLLQASVWCALPHGFTAHHLLSHGVPCCTLVIQRLPSWYNETSLYNLFSQNYPTMYKAIIQVRPKTGGSAKYKNLFEDKPTRMERWRSFVSRSASVSPFAMSNNNSQVIQGVVFFSCPLEARRALVQMDGYVIPAKQNTRHNMFGPYGGYYETTVRFAEKDFKGFFATKQKRKRSRTETEFDVTMEKNRRSLQSFLLASQPATAVNNLGETPLAGLINQSFLGKIEEKSNERAATSTTDSVRSRPLTEWGRFPSLRSRSTTSDTEFRAGYEGTQGSQALPIVHPIYSYYMPQRMRPPDTISHPFWSPTIQLSSRRGFGRGRIISPSSQEQSSIGSDWIDVCAAPNPRMFFSSRDGDDALSRLQRVHSLDTLSDRTRDSEEEPATVPSEDDDPWAAPEQPPSSTREEFSEDVSTSFSIENLIRETDGFFHQLEASQRRCGEVVPFQGIQDSTFNMSEVLSNTMLPHLPPVSLSSSHLMSLSPSASLPPLTLRSTDTPPEPTFTPPPPFATPPPTFSTATSNTFNSPVSTGVFSTTTGTFSSAFSTATSTSSSSTNVASPTPSEPPLMFTDYEDELPDMPSVEKQLCTDWNSVVTTLYSCFTGLKQLPDDINFKAGGAPVDESTEEVDVKQEQEQGDAKPTSGKEKLSSEGSQGKGKKRRRAEQDETVTRDSGAFDESKIERMLERTAEESCDAEMMPFVHNLIANTTVGLDIADTVVEQINEKNEGALFIGILFSRALAKYLTLQYTNLGPRECLRELPEYKLITTTKELMTKFGWLGVWEIVHASQALLLPLQYNVYKTQAHLSTQDHHIFPHPPGYMLASDFQVSPAISTHPSTYLRQCPRLLTRPTKAPSPNHGGVFLPRLHPEDEDDSAEELSADEGENSDTNNPTLNFFDVVDSFFNPNPPPASSTDQDPFFMWAVDGQPNPHRPVLRRQTSSMDDQLALLRENGNERGKNILACVFSRMAKCATDLASTAHCNKVCTPLKKRSEECLQSWWAWIEPVLISLEAQFNKAAEFDLEKYAVMLKQGEKKFKSMYNPTTLSKSSITASFPQEYVMYLLDSHTSNVCKSLPITDIKSYKHVVYIFDAMYYIVSKWPTVHNGAGESAPSSSTEQPKENYFLKRSPSLDVLTDLAEGGGAVLSGDLERSVEEQLPLALQPHLLTPLVPKEKLFSNQIRQERSSSSWRRKEALRQHEASSLLSQTAAQLLSTWDTTTRIFSKYYLGEGPGIEQSSVLNLRACYSGKIARFVRQTKELRYFVQSRGRQEMRDPFPRMHNLHIYVNRKTVLKDSFRVLLEMTHLQPVNYNVKFEGEEGGGPGVNRGWFSAVCAALRDDTSYPDQAAPLFWCPGRQPEQADIVAPRYWGGDPLLCKERIEGFRACGRYLGLALWFKQTLPFKVCRHVWKFLLKRQLCWADLAFYNADLYEGLRATLNDARWMTEEEFAEVYGYCSFEAQIENTTTEFFPGGSNLSLTKGNAERYVQSYSEHVMVGRVQEELVALRAGFTDILPPHTLSGLTAEDLTLLLSGGTGDIPFERLYNIITFANSIGCSQSKMEQFKRWFWRIIKEMTMAERQHLLYFATGSSTLPPVDHTTEQTRDRINITVDVVHDSRNALPMASTCGQRISIPLYRSRAMLQSKLATALHCKTYGLG